MELLYSGKIENGKLFINNRHQFDSDITNTQNCKVSITIQRIKSRRSFHQNKYYWIVVGIIASEVGYTKDELHEVLKYKFLKKELPNKITGEIETIIRSTTDLSISEFQEYIQSIVIWAGELGIQIPQPNEQIKLNV